MISFNTSKHFLLREPTSVSGLGESVANLYVVRNPEEGTFGTVSVQYTITDSNGTLAEGDLMPPQGFVVLEDGVRFKVRERRLDELTGFRQRPKTLNLHIPCFHLKVHF